MDFYRNHQRTDGDRSAAETGARTHGAPQPPRPARVRPAHHDLIQIIEGEIIPRLFLAHRDRAPHILAGARCAAGELSDSAVLARLFVDGDAPDIVNRLETLLGDGMRRDRLYLELLAPVPATLSRLWAEGAFSFDEIALGLNCLDDVLQRMHDREDAGPEAH